MTNKKLYTANYICKIGYTSRFLFWKEKIKTTTHWDAEHVIYNTEEFAQKYFENYDTYFRANAIPSWYLAIHDIPNGYIVIEKKCEIVELDHSLEYLKNHMMSSDFLEYCKDSFGLDAPNITIK